MEHGNRKLAEAYRVKVLAERKAPGWRAEQEAWWKAHEDKAGDAEIRLRLTGRHKQRG